MSTTNSNSEIDLFAIIQTSTVDLEEQNKTRQMLKDLDNFSRTDNGERVINYWALNFIDDLSWRNDEFVFSEKQIEKIDELHTKYLVDEDY
jgi:hypothetical protein